MAFMIGYLLGMYIFYAIIAKFSKHKTAFIVTSVIGVAVSISNVIAKGNYMSIIAYIIFLICVGCVSKIQINNK